MSASSLKWDQRFLQLAGHVSEWSKDPSTRCGAVIVRPDKTIASLGFNGYPRHLPDEELDQRFKKYERIIHAEMNALLFLKEPPVGYTMYVWPMLPCNRCAAHIIQVGIKKVVSLPITKATQHWSTHVDTAVQMFQEAGVNIQLLGMPTIPVLDRFGEEDTH